MLPISNAPFLPHPELPRSQTAWMPATCGELVQGSLDGVPFLVSCPIERFNAVTITSSSFKAWKLPSHLPKLSAAIRKALVCLPGAPLGGVVEVQSGIPSGRGYGSSTADIGAGLFALSRLSGDTLAAQQAAQIAVQVEPTDSSLFEGLARFDHRGGSQFEPLGAAPRLDVLVIDPGGSVDTQDFNRLDHRAELHRLAPDHHQAYRLLKSGLQQRDLHAVGEAASLSARLHQAILFNPLLETAQNLARQIGALGVCRAHSGTLLGLLINPEELEALSALAYLRERLPSDVTLEIYPITGGGPRFAPPHGKEPV